MGKVLNKYVAGGIPAGAMYIGRGSPAGNPYPINASANRDDVCDRYENDLRTNQKLIDFIRKDIGDKDVVCFCAQPGRHVRCHGDTVVGVGTMKADDLAAWKANKFSLRGFDPNREAAGEFVGRQNFERAEPQSRRQEGIEIVLHAENAGKPLYVPDQNIVLSRADLLVNTVNTVGVMGKGVALAFKQAFPDIMPAYQAQCRSGALKPGGCTLLPLPDGRQWAALATKQDWRNPSRVEWVESGLQEMAKLARANNVNSIALPPPGCGNGGLDWRQVEPMVLKHLAEFDLRIFAKPSDGRTPAEANKERSAPVSEPSRDPAPAPTPAARAPDVGGGFDRLRGNRAAVGAMRAAMLNGHGR